MSPEMITGMAPAAMTCSRGARRATRDASAASSSSPAPIGIDSTLAPPVRAAERADHGGHGRDRGRDAGGRRRGAPVVEHVKPPERLLPDGAARRLGLGRHRRSGGGRRAREVERGLDLGLEALRAAPHPRAELRRGRAT